MTSPTQVTKEIQEIEKKAVSELTKSRDSAYSRFPLLFTLLGAFGVVATFYGFEHMIDSIPLLADNPFILLTAGIGTLIFTGTLYKKLG